MNRLRRRKGAAIAIALFAAACGSPAQRAADAMAQGQALAAAGRYREAQAQFDIAVRARDDLPELWLARARNQLALADYGGAYQSFRAVLDQDKTNRDALNVLSQISLLINQLDDARKYANQILVLDPSDVSAKLVLANVALRTGKTDDADKIVTAVLQAAPGTEPALVTKSRILQRRGDLAGAEAAILPVFEQGRASADLRRQLTSVYQNIADANGLARVARADVAANPDAAGPNLALAQQLLLTGRTQEAGTLLDALHGKNATDSLRDQTVIMLVDGAVPLPQLTQLLAALPKRQSSLVIAAADYATGQGDAALAIRWLAPLADAAAPDAATTDLHAAYALALARAGRIDDAGRRAAAVLALDDDQPEALAARTLVELARHDLDGALRDARIVVSDSPASADAAALLAQVYAARGEGFMVNKILADGFNRNRNDTGFAINYAGFLARNNRLDDAMKVARDFTIRQPASVGGWSLRQRLCRQAGDGGCATRAGTILARLHGAKTAMPGMPAEEMQIRRDDGSSADQPA